MATSLVAEQPKRQLSYYRSQIYTTTVGLNPLVTAAQPLLSLIERLKFSTKTTLSDYKLNLLHELKAFETRARNYNYDEETILLSIYLIIATLDDLSQQAEPFILFHELLPESSLEKTPDEQVYIILETIIDKPDHYLDLLELIYLCLTIGFQGKYKHQSPEKRQLIINDLYETISPLRKHTKNTLLTTPKNTTTAVESKRKLSFAIMAALSLVVGTLMMSHHLLNQQAKQILSPLSVSMDTIDEH